MTNDAWGRVRETLATRIGKNNYTSWIEPLRLVGLTDGVVRFDVPTTFFGDWVSRNFSDHILALLNAEGHRAGRVEFTVPVRAPVEVPKP
ncbi:MAG: chromosomal replication initiation protein, partial [uncultured bacterium]